MKPSETIWTPEQQKAHRKLWVDALRSGKYGQCRDQLIDGNEYCCLGVLADIAGYNWRNWSEMNDQDAPSLAVEFVGLKTSIGYFYEPQDQALRLSLAGLNDVGKSFAEIANIIESEPPGLFADASA